MRSKLTFSEYDALVERLKALPVQPGKYADIIDGCYFPPVSRLEQMHLNMKDDGDYVIWLLECQPEGYEQTMTEAQRKSRKYLQKMAYDYITFLDDDDENLPSDAKEDTHAEGIADRGKT